MIGMPYYLTRSRELNVFRLPITREVEALQILADLHGNGDPDNELVQLEFAEIKGQVHFERTEGAKSYVDLLNQAFSGVSF